MEAAENSRRSKNPADKNEENKKKVKPPFRPAQDDTKPLLQDPILRSDPIETEEAVLRLPPFTSSNSKPYA